MANKKITDVDVVSTINDADYLFVNQNSAIRQIKKSNIIKDISIDTTLSVAGQAADAKATGDAISQLSEDNAELKSDLNALKETGIPSADIEKAVSDYLTKHPVSGGLSEAQVNSLIDNKLGVIENGTY